MDFHGLARRQLQALCKLNKIPANLTNLAMADALSALDSVEGVEEIMQQQSPVKAEGGAAEEPKTVTRTSTRARKPPVKVLESGGTVSKTTSMTSRELVDDKSFEDDRNDVAKTPAVANSRKRGTVVASRRKVEAPSVQKVYSTRRSVRLIEKQMSELCLGESRKKTQPIKIDNELSSEMTEHDVKSESLNMDKSERNAEILDNDEVSSSEVSAHHVGQGNKGSCVDMTPGEVEKAISEACVEEAAGAMGNADSDAERNSKIIRDGVCNLETEDVVDKGDTEKFVKETLGITEVAVDLTSGLESEIGSVDDFDSAIKVKVNTETSVGSVNVEEGVNEVMKVEKEANKHDSNMPEATVEGNSGYLEQTSELDVTDMESANGIAIQIEGNGNKESTASTLVNEECLASKTQFKDKSIRELRKLLKQMNEMKISTTGKHIKEGHATKEICKHPHTPRPRQALRPLPDNTEA